MADDDTVEVADSAMEALARGDGPPELADDLDDAKPFRRIEDDDYSLHSELGRGGMGQVLLGADRRLGRRVAVKRLLEASPAREARFVREMLITARLQHPNIVPIYDAGRRENGELVYTMRRVDGRTLRELLSGSSLDERLEHLSSLIAVSDAIAYAHAEGIVHRDIKPSNIVVGEFGETVVIDWGLAKVIGSGEDSRDSVDERLDPDLTVAGSALGTPRFMPPEQMRGEEVDGSADVYALGACLYQVLTGEAPLAELSSDDITAESVVPPASELEPKTPSELVAIASAAMSKDKGERPTAKELADELRRFQVGALVELHHYSRLDLIRRWISRHRLVTAVSIGAAALVAALLVRLAFEVNRTQKALGDVELKSDSLAIESARGQAQFSPIEALEALDGIRSTDENTWRRARVISGAAERAGLPTAITVLDDRATSLDLSNERLVAAGPDYAWWIDPLTGTAKRHELPPAGRRVDTTHWVGWRGADAVVFDVASGETRVARTFEARTDRISASAGGYVVASVKGGRATVYRGDEIVFSEDDIVDVVISPDGKQLGVVRKKSSEKPQVARYAVGHSEPLNSQGSFGPDVIGVEMLDNDAMLVRLGGPGQLIWHGRSSYAGICDALGTPALRPGRYACANQETIVIGPFDLLHKPVSAAITDVEFAADAEVVAASTQDGRAFVFALGHADGRLLDHDASVEAVAMAADGRTAYTLTGEGVITAWRLADMRAEPVGPERATQQFLSGRERQAMDGIGTANPIALITADDGIDVVFTQRRDGKPVLARRRLGQPAVELDVGAGSAAATRVSADNRWLAVALRDADQSRPQTLVVVELAENSVARRIELPSPVMTFAFARESEQLLVGDADGAASAINIRSGARRLIGKADSAISAIAGHRDVVAFAGAGTRHVTVVDDGQQRSLDGHLAQIVDIDFSPDGASLVSIANEAQLISWSLATGEPRDLARRAGSPSAVRFINDDDIVAFGERGLAIIDRVTGEFRQPSVARVRAMTATADTVWFTDGVYVTPIDNALPRERQALKTWIKARLAESRR